MHIHLFFGRGLFVKYFSSFNQVNLSSLKCLLVVDSSEIEVLGKPNHLLARPETIIWKLIVAKYSPKYKKYSLNKTGNIRERGYEHFRD